MGKNCIAYQTLLLLHFSCNWQLNLLSWQGSRTKSSLSNTWASSFYSFRKGKQHISILPQWTLLLQSCVINHRSCTHMENTLRYLKLQTKQTQLLVLWQWNSAFECTDSLLLTKPKEFEIVVQKKMVKVKQIIPGRQVINILINIYKILLF